MKAVAMLPLLGIFVFVAVNVYTAERERWHVPHSWELLGIQTYLPKYIAGNEYMPIMNEFWGTLYVSSFLLLWRFFSVECASRPLQAWLRAALGRHCWVLQWHTILYGVLCLENFIAIFHLLWYDWGKHGFNEPEGNGVRLELPLWLISSLPVISALTFVVLTPHVFTHIRGIHRLDTGPGYQPSDKFLRKFWEADSALVCIMLPGIFATMSTLAFSRLWQIFVQGVDNAFNYLSLFSGNMLLSVIFEFGTILYFARLVMSHLPAVETTNRETKGEHAVPVLFGKPPIFFLTMNGVVLCVVLGVLEICCHAGVLICAAILAKQHVPVDEMTCPSDDPALTYYCGLHDLADNFHKFASGAVLLAAYNMFFVCKLPAVTEKLGNANLKFTGARLIVMLAQIQSGVLVVNSIDPQRYSEVLSSLKALRLEFDGYNAALLHVVLCHYEILIIVILHTFTWHDWVERHLKPTPDNDLSEPLKPCRDPPAGFCLN